MSQKTLRWQIGGIWLLQFYNMHIKPCSISCMVTSGFSHDENILTILNNFTEYLWFLSCLFFLLSSLFILPAASGGNGGKWLASLEFCALILRLEAASWICVLNCAFYSRILEYSVEVPTVYCMGASTRPRMARLCPVTPCLKALGFIYRVNIYLKLIEIPTKFWEGNG